MAACRPQDIGVSSKVRHELENLWDITCAAPINIKEMTTQPQQKQIKSLSGIFQAIQPYRIYESSLGQFQSCMGQHVAGTIPPQSRET
jgi:hypothetical protein